jgi:hypothetical protein
MSESSFEIWPLERSIVGLTYMCECGFTTVNPGMFESHYATQFCMGYRKGRDAEREQCAKIAEQEYRQEAGDAPEIHAVNVAARRVAKKIRGGATPHTKEEVGEQENAVREMLAVGMASAHRAITKNAIAEERERCAKIAEDMTWIYEGPPLRVETLAFAQACIAATIRHIGSSQAMPDGVAPQAEKELKSDG